MLAASLGEPSGSGGGPMAQPHKHPLRSLTGTERAELERVARSAGARADRVACAKQLLAVADGARFTDAARQTGRRSGDAVALLVQRFNALGLAALDARHGGGPPVQYGAAERDRILREFRRPPDRQRDGTATWSLSTLQRALRRAADGLPNVSTYTIWVALHEADISWQRDRSWCHTGAAIRKRKRGEVEVHDPDANAKKA